MSITDQAVLKMNQIDIVEMENKKQKKLMARLNRLDTAGEKNY